MAYPRYITKSAFASGTGALTVGALTSTQAGDIIILFVESANQTISTPTDYSVLATQVGTGTAGAAGGVRIATFYRILGDTADTSTTVADSGDHTTAIKMLFRDTALLDGSFYVTATSTQGTASTAMTFPAVTTGTDESLVVLAVALDTDAASTATVGAVTNANLANITERHDETVIAGAGGGLAVITGEKATAGSTGTSTATGSTSVTRAYHTISLSRIAAQTTTSSFNTVSNTTYVPVSDALRITADSSGKVTAVASGTFQPNTLTNGTYALNFKWYYRQLGTDTWTASAAQASTVSALVSAGVLDTVGEFSDTENVTGLTNGVEYEFVLFATRTSATPTNTISFSATATISVPKSIIADGGTYSYTGGAANLLDNKKVIADPVSFSYTGGAANLLDNKKITADSGSYTYTGTAANTNFNRKVIADSGSYSYTGTAAGLVAVRKVIADPVTFSYTGGAANLYDNKLITADSGSFAYTGEAANLVTARKVTADTGNFNYSGTDANLTSTRSILADGATYSYSGNAANLAFGKVIVADSSIYTITGQDATLRLTAILQANGGTYSYSGTDAQLKAEKILVADGISYSYTGQDAFLNTARSIIADSVSYSLTGQAATFIATRKLEADSAAFAYNGSTAGLLYNRSIVGGSGSFSFSLADADLVYELGITKIRIGNTKLTNVKLGNFTIYEVYHGATQVWGRARPANIINAEKATFTYSSTDATIFRGRKMTANGASYALTGTAATLKFGHRLIADSGTYTITGGSATLSGLIPNGFTYTDDVVGTGTVQASLQLASNGTASYSTGAAQSWYAPATTNIGASYWAELVAVSGTGTMSGSALSTRIQISSEPQWILTRSTLGVSSRTFTLNIYNASTGGSLLSSGTVTLTAESS